MAVAFLYENRQKYAAILASTLQEALEGPQKDTQLSLMAQPDRARVATSVFKHKSNSPQQKLDLIYPLQNQQDAPEEVILRIQGYLIRTDLPPILTQQRLPRNIVAAKQSVRLTGLGQESFDASAVAILELQQVLAAHLPENAMEKYRPGLEEGCLTLEFYNRYFTMNEGSHEEEATLNGYIDPLSILRDRTPADAKHTTDNVVLYYERQKTANTYKYLPANPAGIRVGNLVEIQVAFSAISVAKGRYKLLTKLRSVCTLNRLVGSDMNRATIASLCTQKISPLRKMKRHAGYDADVEDSMDDTSEACASLKRLKFGSHDDGSTQ